ncbi:MAG: aminodeoxychorismate/anthranilate synthase component II [Firmicutes bacterium]|nr:aminodeoxychorismate/anthranilate synthase component II [Bacillota bacterium]
MYLMIDNYDSFVYNLVSYFLEEGCKVKVIRCEEIQEAEILSMIFQKELKGIVISPGPKGPEDYPQIMDVLDLVKGFVPILGVCLGHQIIGHYFGAEVKKGHRPMHGKISTICHNNSELFYRIPPSFSVTRYHSLIIDNKTMPESMEIDAATKEDEIMAIHHLVYPIYGIQFHPEAVLTDYGHTLIRNFISICERHQNENHR